jgi:hypothetical protein
LVKEKFDAIYGLGQNKPVNAAGLDEPVLKMLFGSSSFLSDGLTSESLLTLPFDP